LDSKYDHDKCIRCGIKCTYYLCNDCAKKANAEVIHTTVEIPPDLYEEWDALYSADTLGENRARGVFLYHGKHFVNIGGLAGTWFEGHEVISAEAWDGPTYGYGDLPRVNGTGGPFHGNCQKFTCRGEAWVMLPNLITRFIRKDEPVYKQVSMF
jgi:hypothetical protein